MCDAVPASLRSTYAPLAAPPTRERPLHVVLACTGSVASVKVPLIVRRLLEHAHVHVYVVTTSASRQFFDVDSVQAMDKRAASFSTRDLAAMNATGAHSGNYDAPRVRVWGEEDEWSAWTALGDPVLHIELRRWADVVLVAPCSANTLAKLVHGLCDNVLVRERRTAHLTQTSLMRALSPTTPTWLFPAMNTLMYMHPLTERQLHTVRELGYEVHGPIEKRLACGDFGNGAMLEWTDIVALVVQRFHVERL